MAFFSYLLTFKFSQDPLETLFSTIRASLGFNNNPTVIQFTAAFKKILLGAANRSNYSNSSEGYYKVLVQTNPKHCIDTILDHYEHDSDFVDLYLSSNEGKSPLKNDVLVYIAGYVQKKIFVKVKCEPCKDYLRNRSNVTCPIIQLKNNNKAKFGLQKPKDIINYVVQECEQILVSYHKTHNILTEKNLMFKLVLNTKVIVLEKKPSILQELDDHSQDDMDSHRLLLLQKICELFFSLRLKHIGNTYKTDVHQVRHILSKIILFKNN